MKEFNVSKVQRLKVQNEKVQSEKGEKGKTCNEHKM